MDAIIVGHQSTIESFDLWGSGEVPQILPRPLHIVVEDRQRAWGTSKVVPHGWRLLPDERLLSLGTASQGVAGDETRFLACPVETALLQMAGRMSCSAIALLICQLAGTYRVLRPEAVAAYKHVYGDLVHVRGTGDGATNATCYGLQPITSIARITESLDWQNGAWGSNRVREALPLAHDGLASPLEAQQYILAFTSRRRGGLGLPTPLVNQAITLTPEARRFVSARSLRPDFWWPERNTVLEIQGHEFHGSYTGIADTSRRQKAYAAMGIAMMTTTAPEIQSAPLFQASMEELAHRLGHAMGPDTPGLRRKRENLRREVLGQ